MGAAARPWAWLLRASIRNWRACRSHCYNCCLTAVPG